MSEEIVYLNGAFVPHGDARVSVEDRGLNFADGVYDVVRIVGGRGFRLDEHVARVAAGLRALEIPFDPEAAGLAEVLLETARRNRVEEGTVYVQVTRGPAPRKHAFPDEPRPTVFAWARPFPGRTPEERERGVACITVPDTRWALCEIKTIGLLPNVLANERARRAGAYEALFVRDGALTEGSHSSAFAVFDGVLWTHPVRNILPGITRRLVLAFAREMGIAVCEEPVPVDRLYEADEVFLTGTTTEVLPVVRLDGRPVGSGAAGPVTRRLQARYLEELERVRRGG